MNDRACRPQIAIYARRAGNYLHIRRRVAAKKAKRLSTGGDLRNIVTGNNPGTGNRVFPQFHTALEEHCCGFGVNYDGDDSAEIDRMLCYNPPTTAANERAVHPADAAVCRDQERSSQNASIFSPG